MTLRFRCDLWTCEVHKSHRNGLGLWELGEEAGVIGDQAVDAGVD
jgi:hypothetical protein